MRTSRSDPWIAMIAICAAACSSPSGPDASVDAAHASVCADAGVPRDAGPTDGATFTCPTFRTFQCDSFGRGDCWDWAQRVGAGLTDPSAVCVGVADGGPENGAHCARGDDCTSLDESSCRCGRHPACGIGQVCARRSPCDPLECLPCRADG